VGPSPPLRAEPGLRLIVFYKLGKAALELALSAIVALLARLGLAGRVEGLAIELRDQLAHAWSNWLARTLLSASGHLRLVVAALAFDGALSLAEGLALRRGLDWGAWLVVGATSLLLPIEVVELARRPRATRVLLLFANLAVLAYLVRRELGRRRARRER
jgi:uncharacterized membrane protein (DUF2068 family)